MKTVPNLRLHAASLLLLLLTLLSLLVGIKAHGQTWDVGFTETITQSNNAAYQVGEQLTGTLQWTGAEDGTFYADELAQFGALPQGANASLTGLLPIGLPTAQVNYVPAGYGITDYPVEQTEYRNFLTVAGGVVTAFDWQDQIGWSDPWFGEGPVSGMNFEFYTGGSQEPPSVVLGTLAFGTPVDPPSAITPVPDEGMIAVWWTFWMAVVWLGLFWMALREPGKRRRWLPPLLLLGCCAAHGQTVGTPLNLANPPTVAGGAKDVFLVGTEWQHPGYPQIKVLSITQDSLTLECRIPPSSTGVTLTNVDGNFYPMTRERLWREVYGIEHGKLTLLRIITPKMIPAQDARVEWPEEAKGTP